MTDDYIITTDPDEAGCWFLGFGDKVTVTGPPEMVDKMRETILKTAERYEESARNRKQ